jgi:hypothetical protein
MADIIDVYGVGAVEGNAQQVRTAPIVNIDIEESRRQSLKNGLSIVDFNRAIELHKISADSFAETAEAIENGTVNKSKEAGLKAWRELVSMFSRGLSIRQKDYSFLYDDI